MRYFFTRFGSQSFFFFFDTKPHSLQHQSPGFARRIGFPCWQLMAKSLAGSRPSLLSTIDTGGRTENCRPTTILSDRVLKTVPRVEGF
jgi:hypothetical protein